MSNDLIGLETLVIGVRTVDRRLELGRVDWCGVAWYEAGCTADSQRSAVAYSGSTCLNRS